jgi:glycosyltransferase involved in cell wall biosynthesis
LYSFKSSQLICSVKVLILHQHFNTPEKGGALRSYFLAKALVDRGHQPIVITAHNQKHLQVTNVEGIEVHYLPIAYDNAFGFYKRIRSFLAFIVQAAKIGSSLSGIEKCYAMSTPLTVGLAAILLKWRKGIPFIFETGDLWPDAPIQLGFVKNPILKFLLYRLEGFIYHQSESLVALSVQMKSILEKKAPGKVVHLIPNMADTDFFTPSSKQIQLEEKFRVKDRFVVSYIGSIGFANGLDTLLACAGSAKKNNLPVTILLCGDGAMVSSLKEKVKTDELENVVFIPFQHREGVKEIMNITDAIFISYLPHPILETGSPNKYFDGLAAGKLIITNFSGWIKEEILAAGCGFSLRGNDPDDFVEKLKPFIKNRKALIQAQQESLVLASRYERRVLGKTFADIFHY